MSQIMINPNIYVSKDTYEYKQLADVRRRHINEYLGSIAADAIVNLHVASAPLLILFRGMAQGGGVVYYYSSLCTYIPSIGYARFRTSRSAHKWIWCHSFSAPCHKI